MYPWLPADPTLLTREASDVCCDLPMHLRLHSLPRISPSPLGRSEHIGVRLPRRMSRTWRWADCVTDRIRAIRFVCQQYWFMQPFPGPSQGPGVIEQTTHLSSLTSQQRWSILPASISVAWRPCTYLQNWRSRAELSVLPSLWSRTAGDLCH
jgi:hypothetical protein